MITRGEAEEELDLIIIRGGAGKELMITLIARTELAAPIHVEASRGRIDGGQG
jgi:predicted fused transcriptional regulator/phosphomethylpyrimidine kinase